MESVQLLIVSDSDEKMWDDDERMWDDGNYDDYSDDGDNDDDGNTGGEGQRREKSNSEAELAY